MSGQFELQVRSGSRWSFHSLKNSESEAVQEARQLLKSKIADQVQVIARDAKGNEDIRFDEDQSSVKKKAGIGHIEDSPVWNTVDDLYTEESRIVLRRLLRDYFDQEAISPSEILHTYRAMEAFCDDPLCGSALDRLATIQAVKAKENEQERRDKLYDLFQGVQEKARSSGNDDIRPGELNNYLAEAGDIKDPAVRFRVMMSLSQPTTRATSWEAKLSVLFDLLGDVKPEDLHENTSLLLDDLISEMFAMPTVIQDMLGQQPDRYNAMKVLIQMCIAKYEARKWDTAGLKRISELMRKLPMVHCRTALANQVEQMLRNRSALTKGDMLEEKHAFKELLPLFIAKNGSILGGEGMAEALTMCGTRSHNRDRSLDKPAEAINHIVETLQAPILQLRYLLTLSKSQFGKDCANIVSDFIPSFMDGPEHVHDVVHYRLPLKRKLKILSGLQKMALEVELPGGVNMQLVEWLDDLLYNFLDEERIIDKMDSPEEPLFIRATNLLQFCASGMLIEGKTLNWVRERVQDHLRQPNFVEKFTEAADSQRKQEKMITQLHIMLKKAGLKQ
ncbi:hypothetical protein RYZ26_13760 [Terasakiella sp. A23]|uniref:hypothetical protein n=1 Tax=Terasakiella sp. FCG-A23 TaxID=3080561 RepID=UPI002953CFA6|nr:hypothetical protein [Terasakiella sp. A23]MDV7340667.1 hypothetical protein [Terasakiella sp. A23]